ncbi:MAG TPA: DUF473 domain-containing protein [Candidatus Nanoarchaeia archaeon]|nr:DUF473 domain-containing protein [Candidatus Nanoarchaeia archaeon]
MQYIAITGISSQVLKELQDNRVRTIEIRSPHNFFSVNTTNPGDIIFLTRSSYDDINAGTIGLLAMIKGKQVFIHRILHKSDEIFEECETFAARLQLELDGIGRVRKVEETTLGKPLEVDADKVTYLEAR